jgi:hypothetical protein
LVLIAVIGFYIRRDLNRNSSCAQIGVASLLPAVMKPPTSPLVYVSFDRALQSADLTNEVPAFARKRVAYSLGLDPANVVIQGMSLSENGDGILVSYEFSKRGMRLWQSRKAFVPTRLGSDNLIPQLSDAQTGRFIEQAQGKRVFPSHFPQISSLVVSAAHVIAGMDMVERLERLDRKLDVLLQGREFDQKAELEEIYQMARERLSGTLIATDRQDMLRWRGDLYRLRSVWRQELEQLIADSPDPDRRKLFHPTTWKQNWREENTRDHMISGAKRLRLTKVAFAVDLYLAFETDSLDKFVTITMPDEQALWTPVVESIKALSAKMESEHAPDVKALAEAVCGYQDALKAITTDRAAQAQLNG